MSHLHSDSCSCWSIKLNAEDLNVDMEGKLHVRVDVGRDGSYDCCNCCWPNRVRCAKLLQKISRLQGYGLSTKLVAKAVTGSGRSKCWRTEKETEALLSNATRTRCYFILFFSLSEVSSGKKTSPDAGYFSKIFLFVSFRWKVREKMQILCWFRVCLIFHYKSNQKT